MEILMIILQSNVCCGSKLISLDFSTGLPNLLFRYFSVKAPKLDVEGTLRLKELQNKLKET
jgi:hypothetical protein